MVETATMEVVDSVSHHSAETEALVFDELPQQQCCYSKELNNEQSVVPTLLFVKEVSSDDGNLDENGAAQQAMSRELTPITINVPIAELWVRNAVEVPPTTPLVFGENCINTLDDKAFDIYSQRVEQLLVEHEVIKLPLEISDISGLKGTRLLLMNIFTQLPFDPGKFVPPSIMVKSVHVHLDISQCLFCLVPFESTNSPDSVVANLSGLCPLRVIVLDDFARRLGKEFSSQVSELLVSKIFEEIQRHQNVVFLQYAFELHPWVDTGQTTIAYLPGVCGRNIDKHSAGMTHAFSIMATSFIAKTFVKTDCAIAFRQLADSSMISFPFDPGATLSKLFTELRKHDVTNAVPQINPMLETFPLKTKVLCSSRNCIELNELGSTFEIGPEYLDSRVVFANFPFGVLPTSYDIAAGHVKSFALSCREFHFNHVIGQCVSTNRNIIKCWEEMHLLLSSCCHSLLRDKYFLFDPGSGSFTTFLVATRNCEFWDASSCLNDQFVLLEVFPKIKSSFFEVEECDKDLYTMNSFSYALMDLTVTCTRDDLVFLLESHEFGWCTGPKLVTFDEAALGFVLASIEKPPLWNGSTLSNFSDLVIFVIQRSRELVPTFQLCYCYQMVFADHMTLLSNKALDGSWHHLIAGHFKILCPRHRLQQVQYLVKMHCLLSSSSHDQTISINFPFAPGSSEFTTILGAARNFVFWDASSTLEHDHDPLMPSTLWNSCIAPLEFWLRNSIDVFKWVDIGLRLEASKFSFASSARLVIDIYVYIKSTWLNGKRSLLDRIYENNLLFEIASLVPPPILYLIFWMKCTSEYLMHSIDTLLPLLILSCGLQNCTILNKLQIVSNEFSSDGFLLLLEVRILLWKCWTMWWKLKKLNDSSSVQSTRVFAKEKWKEKAFLLQNAFMAELWAVQFCYASVAIHCLLGVDIVKRMLPDFVFCLNLEDKVLIEGGGIVMNYSWTYLDISTIGSKRSNWARSYSPRLIWDPGPIRI